MKEVVHVPTLELAEKVLKVAKKQGFKEPKHTSEYYFKREGNRLCFRFHEEYFGFASKDFYEKHESKVITAEDFLSKHKTSELEQLRKENAELKEQLKAIQEQPQVGDVCLFWDSGEPIGVMMHVLNEIRKGKKYPYRVEHIGGYENCLKATDENIKKVIEQIKLNNK